jgi:hypothetical protein
LDTSSKASLTKQDLWLLFAACVLPTHIWAIVNILREVPAWVKRMNTFQMVGVMSYDMAVFALPDALLPFLGLLILAAILPAALFRYKLVALGSAFALITQIWLIIFHLTQLIGTRSIVPYGLWGGTYLLAMGLAYFFIRRRPQVEAAVIAFVRRVATLSALYLFLDFVGIIVVIVRNI